MRDGFFAIGLGLNHVSATALCNRVADVVAVIAPVGQEHASRWQVIIDQRIEALEVRYFTSRYFRPDREPVSVGNEVDLGREATF